MARQENQSLLAVGEQQAIVTRDQNVAATIWHETYVQSFEEKRHYDLLSWSIGGGMLAYSAFAMNAIFEMPAEMLLQKMALASSVSVFFVLWLWIYERNRTWGEICNEMARDIERRFGVDGIQLRYMRSHLTKSSPRPNNDLPLELRDLPGDLLKGPDDPIRLKAPSMHYALYALALLGILTPITIAVFSATSGPQAVVKNLPRK